jgi:hypothetical protein
MVYHGDNFVWCHKILGQVNTRRAMIVQNVFAMS